LLLKAAHAAVSRGDLMALEEVAALGKALAPTRERLAESLGQGAAFLGAVRTGWPDAARPAFGDSLVYPVAAGAVTAGLGALSSIALIAYVNIFAINLIAAGVRLGLCGQVGGVRILAALQPAMVDIVRRADSAGIEALGSCALGSDIASMRHETLETRLFMS
jgi:urease accessory protein